MVTDPLQMGMALKVEQTQCYRRVKIARTHVRAISLILAVASKALTREMKPICQPSVLNLEGHT